MVSLFSLGSLLVEIVYVRISLVAMDWIRKQERLFKILGICDPAHRRRLAISSFYSAVHPKVQKNIVLSSTLPKFVLGW